MRSSTIRTLLGITLTVSGCAGAEPVASIAPEAPPVVVADEDPVAEVEPELPLRDRWRAPFAVSSVGEAAPRAPRGVTVVGADPAIAAGRAAIEAARRTRATDDPSAPAPRAPVTGATERRETAVSPTRRGEPAARPGSDEAEDITARDVAEAVEVADVSAARERRTYTVEPGDSWLGIARDHDVSYSALAASNPGVDPERIRIGQILRIPPQGGEADRTRRHQVRTGDTLWGIARRYNVSADLIRRANDLAEDRIRLGQILIIPTEDGDDR